MTGSGSIEEEEMARCEQSISAIQAISCDDMEYHRNISHHPVSIPKSYESAKSLEMDRTTLELYLRAQPAFVRAMYSGGSSVDCQDPAGP